MTRIKVVQEVSHGDRGSYSAFIEGRPEISGDGESEREAVGDLIMRHDLKFDLEVKVEPES